MTTILIAAIGFVVGVLTGAIAVVAFAGWARTPVAHEYPVEIFALSEEDGCGFLAIAPDLPGCRADGWTQREALANLHDAIAEWITDARAMGRPVPEPKYYLAA
jgi:antitoxin HicB